MENGAPRIRFYGFVSSYTGFGTASRAYIHAFDAAAIDMSVTNLDFLEQPFVQDPVVTRYINRQNNPSFHLCHAEPHHNHHLHDLFSRLIILTTWEADRLPQRYVDALNKVLEVWVPSRFNLEVFQRQLKTPVFQIPHPVYLSRPACLSKAQIDTQLGWNEDTFVFLAMGTWQERKNLPAVIEAFLRAFPDEPNAVLIIKTLYAFTTEALVREQMAEAVSKAGLTQAITATKRVRISSTFWPEEYVAALAQRANCFVSLHRGEGWCYPLFDAACNGTPVIATAYSGPMDYLDERHHRLVGYEMTATSQKGHTANFALTSDMSWADPDVSHAAALMRQVFENRRQAMEQAAEGAALLRQKYSFKAVGQIAAKRLAELSDGILTPHSGS